MNARRLLAINAAVGLVHRHGAADAGADDGGGALRQRAVEHDAGLGHRLARRDHRELRDPVERDQLALAKPAERVEIADLAYFEDLVRGVLARSDELDAALAAHVDRDVAQVDQIERAVLRIAAYEMLHRPDVPYRDVINEAIDTAKRFGSELGHAYVNGVLDKAAAEWRAPEVAAARRAP